MGAGEGALGSWGKRIWMSRCFHLFTFQLPPGEHWQIWGRSPPWQICVLSIYVLLNLFLSTAWDWTRTERWLADKKEGREKKKAVFSTSMEYVVQWQSPCYQKHFSTLDTCRAINHCIWPSVCRLNAEAAYCFKHARCWMSTWKRACNANCSRNHNTSPSTGLHI